jgi:hypothetical protein
MQNASNAGESYSFRAATVIIGAAGREVQAQIAGSGSFLRVTRSGWVAHKIRTEDQELTRVLRFKR